MDTAAATDMHIEMCIRMRVGMGVEMCIGKVYSRCACTSKRGYSNGLA